MAKLARMPLGTGALEQAGAEVHHIHRPQLRYFAFLSYSHRDEEIADWLYDQLEQFRVPHSLQGRLTANGVIPKRLTPIFRDQHELAASDDLGEEIRSALQSSQFLVVLCSPNAAKSRWTNAEIEAFKRIRPEGCVLAAIASGEPFASDIPGRESEECLPVALRHKYNRLGRSTGKRAEPLAADLRGSDDQRRIGFLKLVAGMLGVGLDDLVQRETTRRQRRLAWLTAASLAGMAVTSTLAVTAIQARDAARDQRREAEGLVGFMLGDLKDKLEPIGRLDALDGVGTRVLAYYSKQQTSDLADPALLQRSRALSLMAEVAYVRGDLDGAQRLYREAMAGTAEAVRRNPNDPQRLFDHAQNYFWLGDLARQRGDAREAEAAWREYKRLSSRMVAIDPANMKWRTEDQSADANLGVILLEQRRFGEAAESLKRSLQSLQALATAGPDNPDYQKAATEAQGWLTEALMNSGHVDEALKQAQANVTVLQQLLARTGDVEYRQKLVPAERWLGEIYAFRGQLKEALQHTQAAVAHSENLIAHEPENSRWRYFSARARINLAQFLLAAGRAQDAAAETGKACQASETLVERDANVQRWRGNLRECLLLRARLSLGAGDARQALDYSTRALAMAKSIQNTDVAADRFGVATAYRLAGDCRRKLGDERGAVLAWREGLSEIPQQLAEKPTETAEHVMLLQRLGQSAEAQRRAASLRSMGYRGGDLV